METHTCTQPTCAIYQYSWPTRNGDWPTTMQDRCPFMYIMVVIEQSQGIVNTFLLLVHDYYG